MRLVLDSPPLQALHRCGALRLLERAYEEVSVPAAVEDRTRSCREKVGPAKVPDLSEHPWLRVLRVSDAELSEAGASEPRLHRSTTRYRWRDRHVGRPELEVVLLARRLGALAVLEEKRGASCARDAGVTAIGSAEVLCDLEGLGLVGDAPSLARIVLDSGYCTQDLRILASGYRRPAWRLR